MSRKKEINKVGKKGKICENCGSEFASEVGWLQHVRGGRCQKLEDMSESQLKARKGHKSKGGSGDL